MHITEHPSDVRIIPPVMLCDTDLGDSIPGVLPKRHHFMAIVGSAGSGKSSFAISLLKQTGKNKIYRKVFHNIFLIIPQASLASIKSNIFRNHPEDKIFNELTPEVLATIKSQVIADAEEGYQSLIIIDDQTVHLKNKSVEAALRDLIYNRRHYHVSIWILAQSYSQIPLTIRKTLSHFALFKPRNKKESESIFEELIFMPREDSEAVMRHTFKNSHDFLFGNVETGDLHRNFNKLEIKE
jgi:Poxvirus A32 protein